MKLKTIQKILAVGAVAASCSLPAMAAPSFTFTEYAGFTNMGPPMTDPLFSGGSGVVYSNQLLPSADPGAGVVYSDMSWVNPYTPTSSLNLSTVTGPAALPENTWVTISTLTHNNFVIPFGTNWGPQDIPGRFRVIDSDGGASVRLNSLDTITINFTETPNVQNCPGLNPLNSHCDDYFFFTAIGLNSLFFTANDGSLWEVDFTLGNFVNSFFDGVNTVYTAEATSSHLDVLAMVHRAPEPATLLLVGLGLLGLGLGARRNKRLG